MRLRRLHPALQLLVLIAVVLIPARPAAAFDGDMHFFMTYYVARSCGFTREQSRRIAALCLAADYNPKLEPGIVYDPRTKVQAKPELQNRRVWFHAFRNQQKMAFPGSIYKDSPQLGSADAAIRAQRLRLMENAVAIGNPGLLLHFVQDEMSHYGYGSIWGHGDWHVFFGQPKKIEKERVRRVRADHGTTTDFLSYESRPNGPTFQVVANTVETLRVFSQRMNALGVTQPFVEPSEADLRRVFDRLAAADAAPAPTAGNYVAQAHPGLVAADTVLRSELAAVGESLPWEPPVVDPFFGQDVIYELWVGNLYYLGRMPDGSGIRPPRRLDAPDPDTQFFNGVPLWMPVSLTVDEAPDGSKLILRRVSERRGDEAVEIGRAEPDEAGGWEFKWVPVGKLEAFLEWREMKSDLSQVIEVLDLPLFARYPLVHFSFFHGVGIVANGEFPEGSFRASFVTNRLRTPIDVDVDANFLGREQNPFWLRTLISGENTGPWSVVIDQSHPVGFLTLTATANRTSLDFQDQFGTRQRAYGSATLKISGSDGSYSLSFQFNGKYVDGAGREVSVSRSFSAELPGPAQVWGLAGDPVVEIG
jgi:hypothetical protein